MNRLFPNATLLFLPLVLCSCVKDIVMDAGEDPRVVVECVLREDPVQTLYLSYTKGASRDVAPELLEAEAVLTDMTLGREAGRFERVTDGSWQLMYAAIPTHHYRLDVSVPGRDLIWAEQTMPDNPPVESVKINRGENNYPGYEDAGGVLYYSSFPCAIWAYGINYDPNFKQLEPIECLCTDYPFVDNFNLTGEVYIHEVKSPLTYESDLVSASKLNGYALHSNYLRFPKRKIAEQTFFAIDGPFNYSSYYNYEDTPRELRQTESVLFFVALSDGYDKYLCEALQHQKAQESKDLSAIYLRDNLYTNIHGGRGIFGAFTKAPIRISGLVVFYTVPSGRPLSDNII